MIAAAAPVSGTLSYAAAGLIAILALLVGAALVWLMLSRALAKAQAESAGLESELSAAQSRATETGIKLASAEARLESVGRLEADLAKTREDRDAALTKATELERANAQLLERLEAIPRLQEELRLAVESAERYRTESGNHRAELVQLKEQLDSREQRYAELQQSFTEARKQLEDSFKALSGETLKDAQARFLQLAKETLEGDKKEAAAELEMKRLEFEKLLDPMQAELKRLNEASESLERNRARNVGELQEQLKHLSLAQSDLRNETGRLIKALQSSGTAGQWGEMVLERVAEMAGLQKGVNYESQVTQEGASADDKKRRPDMIVRLPGDRTVVIDAKSPMPLYLKAQEETVEHVREAMMKDFAKQVSETTRILGRKDYSHRQDTGDFVVMFIPSEAAFRAALECRPDLIEEAMAHNVVLASPTSLLGLLRMVAFGWRQETMAQEVRAVQVQGAKLYDALATLAGHYQSMSKALTSAVRHFNSMGGSLERTVLPTARVFKDKGIEGSKSVPAPEPIEELPRTLVRDELLGSNPGGLFSTEDDEETDG
ncbi:MAG: DNA recombination protein RmuC [Fimbriimonadaceae bacterium]|nr:DNA recombination protein RmuC [Fimbriimonadaceae bacterium]